MIRKIVIIQPYTERFTAHKFFTQSIKFFIMKQVKIINILHVPIVLCILIFCSSVGLISVLKLFSNLIILFWLIPIIIG